MFLTSRTNTYLSFTFLLGIKNNRNKRRNKIKKRKKNEIAIEFIIFLSLQQDCRQEPNKHTLVACKKAKYCESVCLYMKLFFSLMSNFK